MIHSALQHLALTSALASAILIPPIDPRVLRATTVVLALVLLYGSRMTKGSSQETPIGLVFPIKPLFAWARGIALPIYILFFAYVSYSQHHSVPWWTPLLFIAALTIGLLQMPGTITLTPTAITQNFWFLRSKSIPYNQVASLQTMQGGRITRVLNRDRTIITHTINHVASAQFQAEIQSRTQERISS